MAQSTDDANVAAAISVFNGSVITAIKAYKFGVKGTDSPSIKLYGDFTQKGAVATAAATSQGAINAVQASLIAAMGVRLTAPGTYRAAVITDEATYEPTNARTEVSYWHTMKSTLDTLS